MSRNVDFKQHFPKHVAARNTRQEKMYEEFQTRSTRLYNSPIYHMRRILNEDAKKTPVPTPAPSTDHIALQGILDEWR